MKKCKNCEVKEECKDLRRKFEIEMKEHTRFNLKEKISLGLYAFMTVLSIVWTIIDKELLWGIIALLWFSWGFTDFVCLRTLKLKNFENHLLTQLVDVMEDEIETLKTKADVEEVVEKIKEEKPKKKVTKKKTTKKKEE